MKIENEFLRVEANLLGGSLTSIFDKKKKEEVLYQIEKDSWQGQDVCIFPFVARLEDKTYTYNGKEYSLRNHGLCRYYEFEVVEQKESSLILLLKSNEETLKEYPFAFEFYVTYRLEDKKLIVMYTIVNKSKKVMPFGVGAHPAFKVNAEIKDGVFSTNGNFVQFEKPLQLTRICFDSKGEMVVGKEDFGVKKEIEIDKKLFDEYKTLCVSGDGISDVTLFRKDGYKIKFHYDNINYFVLWSFPQNGAYVAIEPWMSLPDYANADKDIMKKETLIHLPQDETYLFSYSLTIE